MEIWKPAVKRNGVDYTGFYEVSNFGRIKSLSRKWKKYPKILCQHLNRYGYYDVHLSKNGISKRETVHTLVCNAFHDNIENKPEVNHKNGIKKDNNSSNLEWATSAENQIHAFKTGLQISSKGEKHGRSVLKEEDIAFIRASNETRKSLSLKYNVAIRTIFSIRSGRLWSHSLKKDLPNLSI